MIALRNRLHFTSDRLQGRKTTWSWLDKSIAGKRGPLKLPSSATGNNRDAMKVFHTLVDFPNAFTTDCHSLGPVGWSATSFNKLFQNKWFLALFVAMIIVLIVETSIMIFLVIVSNIGRQGFPAISLFQYFKPECPTLTAAIVSQNSQNRTVVFTCSGRPAIQMEPPLLESTAAFPAAVRVLPTFNLPPSYTRLYLNFEGYVNGDCTKQNLIPLTNGKPMTLVGFWSYNYCAIVTNQAGPVDGFTIEWTSSPWPDPCCKISASPSLLTISPGQKSTSTVTLTSEGGFSGNVSFSYGITFVSGGPNFVSVNATFSPPSITLKPGNSNSTTIIVTAFSSDAPEVDRITIEAYPRSVNSFDFPGTRMDITINIA